MKASRLKAIGYGESRPVASNKIAEGKAQNRRVVATLAGTTLVDKK
jgi:OOP family OmpA-OmpF porin